MSFLSSIKKVLNIGQSDNKKRKNFPHIKESDPLQFWDIVGELGDGAFGKVHKARKKDDGRLAAAKLCTIESDEEAILQAKGHPELRHRAADGHPCARVCWGPPPCDTHAPPAPPVTGTRLALFWLGLRCFGWPCLVLAWLCLPFY